MIRTWLRSFLLALLPALWVAVQWAPAQAPPALPRVPAQNAPPRPAATRPPPTRMPALPRPAPVRPTAPGARGATSLEDSIETTGTGRDKLIKLNFREAPLEQVLQFYSQLTGRTMLQSPGITANITLKGQTRLTEDECIEAIDAILAMNNVTLVEMGEKFFKVVQPTAAGQEAAKFSKVLPDEPFAENDKLVSQVIRLQHMEIGEAQPVVQSFLHGYGKIQALERANSLLVRDTSSNLQRIIEILEMIDQPVENKVEMRIYNIRNIEASEIAGKLNELISETQSEEPTQQGARVAAPAPTGPPGVIRALRARQQQQAQARPSDPGASGEAAERGLIQGKVKIIADDRTGILFVFSRPENFAFFDRIIEVLDVSVEADILVRVEPLEYADAEEVAGLLNEFIGAGSAETAQAAEGAAAEAEAGTPRSQALRDFVRQRAKERETSATSDEAAKFGRLSPETRILADKRTNALMLMGRKSDLLALEEMIDQLDVMLAQVLIEAVIMEIALGDDLSYGLDWLQRAFTVVNEEKVGPGGGLTVSQPVAAFGGGSRVLGNDLPFISASTVNRDTPIDGPLSYYMTFFDLNLDAIIQLAASSGDARILSTPVIMTTDNTTARLQVGEERPVVSTTSTTSAGTIRSAFEYRNIGINLEVTPRINPERFVVMEITQSADDVGNEVIIDGNPVPIITKREFEANIGVKSRETIALGGLVRTARRKSRTKIPLLGDIPLLGVLFRSDSITDVRTELMVLITPYVVMTEEEAVNETKRLYDATRLEKSWDKGWSDSPLAPVPESPDESHKKKSKWSTTGFDEDVKAPNPDGPPPEKSSKEDWQKNRELRFKPHAGTTDLQGGSSLGTRRSTSLDEPVPL